MIRCTDAARADGGMADHIGRADYLAAGLVPVTAATLRGADRLEIARALASEPKVIIPACTAFRS